MAQSIREFLLFIAVLLCTACPASAETNVGVILPYSGIFAKYGGLVRKGVESGRSAFVRALYEDEGCRAAPAVKAYRKLTDVDGVKVIFGPMCGSPQTAVAPLVKQGQQVVMLGNSAPEAVFELSGKRMFSAQPSIETEAKFIASEMNKRGIKAVALVFYENDFSRTHEAAFRTIYAGGVIEVFAFTSEDVSTIKSMALRLKQLAPEAVFSPDATPLLLGLLKELKAIGATSMPVWSVYSAQSEEVKKATAGVQDKLIYSYPDIGTEDALEYFPRKGMEMLSAAVGSCGDMPDCIIAYLHKSYPFNEHGTLQGGLALKTIRDGKFEYLK